MCEEENDNVVIHLNERDVSVLVHSIRTPNTIAHTAIRGESEVEKKTRSLSVTKEKRNIEFICFNHSPS